MKSKIGIIGAGASGISLAFYLKEKGYQDVSVLEQGNYVGGKAKYYTHQGENLPLGPLWCGRGYKRTYELAKKAGIPFVKEKTEKLILTQDTNEIVPFGGFFDQKYSNAEYLQSIFHFYVVLKKYEKFLLPGIESFPVELLKPIKQFITDEKLTPIYRNIKLFLEWCGYSYSEDVPSFYTLKLLKIVTIGLFEEWLDHKFQCHFFNPLKRPVTGFQDILSELALKEKLNVSLNYQVKKIEYNSKWIINETLEFDKLIVTNPCLLSAYSGLDPALKTVLKNMNYNYFYVSVLETNKEIKCKSFMLEKNMYRERLGHPIAFYNSFKNKHIQLAYTLGASINEEALIENNIKESLDHLGFNNVKFLHHEKWQYFPHFRGPDITHAMKTLNANQGVNNLFFTGGFCHFESVEHSIEYSKHLSERYF